MRIVACRAGSERAHAGAPRLGRMRPATPVVLPPGHTDCAVAAHAGRAHYCHHALGLVPAASSARPVYGDVCQLVCWGSHCEYGHNPAVRTILPVVCERGCNNRHMLHSTESCRKLRPLHYCLVALPPVEVGRPRAIMQSCRLPWRLAA